MTELQDALVALAERGETEGAATVVDRALENYAAPPTGRRVGRVVLGLAAVIALLVTSLAVYTRNKTNNIDRINIGALADSPGATPEAMNVLLVGTDKRDDYPGLGVRADSIMLVRITRTQGITAVLSFPRDLYVDGERFSEYGTSPERLVAAVTQLSGIAIDHYAQVDFDGFRRLVDAIGGVTIYTPSRLRDQFSGLDTDAGCVHLDATQALAYVRSRHLQELDVRGKWHSDPTGDLGRIVRLQQVLMTSLRRLGSTHDVRTFNRLLDIAADDATLDAGFPLHDVFDRLRQNANSEHALAVLTWPSETTQLSNGAAVLTPLSAERDAIVRAFGAEPLATTGDTGPGPCA